MRRDNVVVSKGTEWSERLSDAVERVLRGALSQRLGPSRVLIPGDGRIPDAELTVEFLELDAQHGVLSLDAKWTYSCRNHANQSDRTTFAGSTYRCDGVRRRSGYDCSPFAIRRSACFGRGLYAVSKLARPSRGITSSRADRQNPCIHAVDHVRSQHEHDAPPEIMNMCMQH